MSDVAHHVRKLAETLVELHTDGGKHTVEVIPAAIQVLTRFREYLAVAIGATGYGGLTARAVALASKEVSWLRAVEVTPEGEFHGIHGLWDSTPEESAQGSIAVVAEFLGLLIAFIGEDLMRQIVAAVWPKIRIADFETGKGESK